MSEAHEAQACHGCGQSADVDDGAHGIVEYWRVAVCVLGFVYVHAPSVEYFVNVGVG